MRRSARRGVETLFKQWMPAELVGRVRQWRKGLDGRGYLRYVTGAYTYELDEEIDQLL